MSGGMPPRHFRAEELFAALGFEPRSRPVGADAVRFELGNCRYWSAVGVNQPVGCTLHQALTQRPLDVLAPSGALRSLVPKDPDRDGCLIELKGAPSPVREGGPS